MLASRFRRVASVKAQARQARRSFAAADRSRLCRMGHHQQRSSGAGDTGIGGWKQDENILAAPFTVGPHTFRYYKFSVPPGSVNMAVAGQFSAVAENGEHSFGESNTDNNIEVYILADAAFSMWLHGNAASPLYDSGLIPMGTIQADLPADVGTYYLVFSNKVSPKTAKVVHATVRLRHKNWLRRVFAR